MKTLLTLAALTVCGYAQAHHEQVHILDNSNVLIGIATLLMVTITYGLTRNRLTNKTKDK